MRTNEVIRLSGLYSALSHVNQAIISLHDREKLFAEVCRAYNQQRAERSKALVEGRAQNHESTLTDTNHRLLTGENRDNRDKQI